MPKKPLDLEPVILVFKSMVHHFIMTAMDKQKKTGMDITKFLQGYLGISEAKGQYFVSRHSLERIPDELWQLFLKKFKVSKTDRKILELAKIKTEDSKPNILEDEELRDRARELMQPVLAPIDSDVATFSKKTYRKDRIKTQILVKDPRRKPLNIFVNKVIAKHRGDPTMRGILKVLRRSIHKECTSCMKASYFQKQEKRYFSSSAGIDRLVQSINALYHGKTNDKYKFMLKCLNDNLTSPADKVYAWHAYVS